MRSAQRLRRPCRTPPLRRLLLTLQRALRRPPAPRPTARRAPRTRRCRLLKPAKLAATLRTRRSSACSRSPSPSKSKHSMNEKRRGEIRGVFLARGRRFGDNPAAGKASSLVDAPEVAWLSPSGTGGPHSLSHGLTRWIGSLGRGVRPGSVAAARASAAGPIAVQRCLALFRWRGLRGCIEHDRLGNAGCPNKGPLSPTPVDRHRAILRRRHEQARDVRETVNAFVYLPFQRRMDLDVQLI